MYSFLFDRKSLILLVAGLGTVGCLLFFAGLLTGVFWGVPNQDGTATAALPPSALPASEPCPPATERLFQRVEGSGEALPSSPELEDDEPVPMLEAEAREQPRRPHREPPTPAIQAALPAAEPEPVPPAVAEEAPAALGESASSPSGAGTGAAPTAAPIVQAELLAEPEPVAAKTETAALRTALYSLQIGAFRLPANSARIAQDLRSKGYDAYVLEEKGTRNMLTVRIGRYADRAEALRAAQDFRQREGQEAIVRALRLGDVRLTSW